ncbi:MAG TPA: tail fiber domain-containing protein, partial [bacterium]|nr:tail fiber domain-containing protein [bacterium]
NAIRFGMHGTMPLMSILGNGNVGIGTTNPDRAKLVVSGNVSYANGSWGYLNSSGTVGTASGGSVPTSIYASERIVCSEFNAVSDERIKIEVPKTDKLSDIEIINKLRPVNYKMKDEIQHGLQIKKGFFAQEVEKVLPDAVSKSADYVPDIFEIAQNIEYNEQQKTLKITLTKPHNLKVNDKARLILKDKTIEKKVSEIFSDYVFSVSDFDEKTDKLFVYGKLVDDFCTLNYEHIFTVGIGAIQELNKKVETQNQELENLKKENAELKQMINNIITKLNKN